MRRCSAKEMFIFVAEVMASILYTIFVAVGIITISKLECHDSDGD